MNPPNVTVVLPVFNRAATLGRCIASVRAQTFGDWELIAVDDGSSDDSIAVIEALGDTRIRVIRHEVNRGPGAARNTALREGRGDFFALIDSDDEWLPGKLAAQLALLDGPPGCDLCGCEYWRVLDGVERRVALPRPPSWAEWLHFQCPLGSGSTLVVRRQVVEAVGLLDETLRVFEDWDWVLRMVRTFRYEVVSEPLARVHAGGPRSPRVVAESVERFLRKNEDEFRRPGVEHWRRVQARQHEAVAALAFEQRDFALGCHSLWKSIAAEPAYRPLRIGAFALAAVDAVCGTSLLRRATKLQRSSRDKAG